MNKFWKTTLILSSLISAHSIRSASAQENLPQSLEDTIPRTVLQDDSDFFTFTLENDKFGNGTDRDYTNGVRLTYFNYSANPPHFARVLDDYIPTFKVNKTTATYYSLGQNMYTPKDTSTGTPNPKDRPYAGFLYISSGLTSLSDNHIDDLEATIGVVGPWSLGEQTQKIVHKTINSPIPHGWDHQLKNEPALMVSWERTWPALYNTELGPLNVRVGPHFGTTLGNVYTYASTGFTVQFTPKKYKWQSQPLRVRPAIPGNGFFAVPDNKFAWSAFAGLDGRAIGQNIFLDGNTFRDSPSVDKKYFVGDANAGLSLTYGKTQISYTLNWRSREFRGQDENAVFGAISVGRRF